MLVYITYYSINKNEKGEHESWDTQDEDFLVVMKEKASGAATHLSQVLSLECHLDLGTHSPPTEPLFSPYWVKSLRLRWQGLCPHFSASEDPSPPSTPTLQQTSITLKTLINIVTTSNVFMESPQRRVTIHSYNIFQLTKFSLICAILHNPDCKSLYRLSYSLIYQNDSHSMANSMQYHQGLQDGLSPRSDFRYRPLVTISPGLTYG